MPVGPPPSGGGPGGDAGAFDQDRAEAVALEADRARTAGAEPPLAGEPAPGERLRREQALDSATGESLLRSRAGGIGRATALMAGGTLASRVTGLLRLLVAAYALGGNRLSDAFNLANNTPNIVHDLVLGGVLAATFVPQFVDRLARRPEAEALESISAVVTMSFVLLAAATVLFFLLSPFIIGLYSLGTNGPGMDAERAVATDLLRLFSFQLFAYGAISVMTALLNTVRRFVLAAFVPLLNNVIAIAVLLAFASAVRRHPSLASVAHDRNLLWLLGLGTTAGVVLQAAALVPAALRSGLRLRPCWRPKDPAIREILSLSGWTFGFVLANQLALFVVLALAVHLGRSRVTDYTYAFQFFQLPYGMIAVSVMSAITPELAHRFSDGDMPGMAHQFGLGLRRMLAGILPASVGYLFLAGPVVALLLRHGAFSAVNADLTGQLLALLAVGLPGYCAYLLCIRALQAMRDTRSAFYLYLVENGLNVLLAFVLTGLMGARGLSLSLSLAYSLSAGGVLLILRRRMGGLGGPAVGRYVWRALLLSAFMGLVVAVVTAAIGAPVGFGLDVRVLAGVLAGLGAYGLGAVLAATAQGWQTSRRRRQVVGKETDARYRSRH